MNLDVPGPAGTLEALLDEARRGTPRAAVVFGHPHAQPGRHHAHEGRLPGLEGTDAHRLRGAAIQFPRRGLSAGTFDEGRGEMGDYQGRARLHGRAVSGRPALGGGVFVRRMGRARDGRGRSARVGAHRHRPACEPNELHLHERTLETTKPKFLIQGSLDELCPLKEMWAFYAKLKEPRELVVIDAANHLFEGKTEEVGDALDELLGDFEQ